MPQDMRGRIIGHRDHNASGDHGDKRKWFEDAGKWGIFVTLILIFGAFAQGYDWINQFAKKSDLQSYIEGQQEKTVEKGDNLKAQLKRIEDKIDGIEKQQDKQATIEFVNDKFKTFETNFKLVYDDYVGRKYQDERNKRGLK